MTGTRWKELLPNLRAVLSAKLNAAQAARIIDAAAFEDSRPASARGNVDLLHLLGVQGDAASQNELGGMYANGRGVKRDLAEAAKWWSRAAEQGHAAAQFSLASLYEQGSGVARDLAAAHRWYSLAASHFPATDPVNAAIAAEFCKSLAAKLPPAVVAESERLIAGWRPTAEAPSRNGRGR